MEPHPDFQSIDLPREFELGPFQLTRLSPDFVEEDFDAVMATADLIEGVFGDWPAGLTLADNLVDLAWHEREFTARRSFAWILRDSAGTYIGCVYLYPDIGSRGRLEAIFWMCNVESRQSKAEALKAGLSQWLAVHLPNGIDIKWNTRPVV
ncbi:MAG: hypothetical protein AAFR45_06190 [Pseudomonadota bacterium]